MSTHAQGFAVSTPRGRDKPNTMEDIIIVLAAKAIPEIRDLDFGTKDRFMAELSERVANELAGNFGMQFSLPAPEFDYSREKHYVALHWVYAPELAEYKRILAQVEEIISDAQVAMIEDYT